MMGARLLAMIPQVPLLPNIGLGTALISYDGRIHWGFTADYDLVPDLPLFLAAVQASFAELAEVAGVKLGADAQVPPGLEGTHRVH
jgi:diacylglycerol O-acyltransferase